MSNEKKKIKKPNGFSKFITFLKSVKNEAKNVRWPSSKELKNSTAVVFAMIVVAGVIVWLFDLGMGALMRILLL